MIVFLDVTIDLYQVRNWGQIDRLLKQELHNKSTCPLQVTDIYLTLSIYLEISNVSHYIPNIPMIMFGKYIII